MCTTDADTQPPCSPQLPGPSFPAYESPPTANRRVHWWGFTTLQDGSRRILPPVRLGAFLKDAEGSITRVLRENKHTKVKLIFKCNMEKRKRWGNNNKCYVHTQFYLALYMCVFILNSFPCGYF